MIRGWEEVVRYSSKKGKRDSVSSNEEPIKDAPEKASAGSVQSTLTENEDMEEDRVIDHLIFVIHGYDRTC